MFTTIGQVRYNKTSKNIYGTATVNNGTKKYKYLQKVSEDYQYTIYTGLSTHQLQSRDFNWVNTVITAAKQKMATKITKLLQQISEL